MLIFIAKRIAVMVLIMIALSIALFLMLELTPGSVATKVLGPYSSEEQRQLWMEGERLSRAVLPPLFHLARKFRDR